MFLFFSRKGTKAQSFYSETLPRNYKSTEKLLVKYSPDRADILAKSRRASKIKAMAGLIANWNGVVCSLKYLKFTFHPTISTTRPFLFFSLQTIAQICFIKTKKNELCYK